MTFVDAESNRSQIACIMVVAESDWMRIQNLPNRIGAESKKSESAHLCSRAEVGPDPEYRSRLRQDSAFFFRTRIRTRN